MEELGERECRLRAVAGVLEQDRVAEHEVGGGDARDLVDRVVPRLDAEQHAERLREEHGLAGGGGHRARGRDARAGPSAP